MRALREANKLLKFAKVHKCLRLNFSNFREYSLRSWSELGILSLSDAAWATRADGSPQRGYMTMTLMVPPQALSDKPVAYAIVDWRS